MPRARFGKGAIVPDFRRGLDFLLRMSAYVSFPDNAQTIQGKEVIYLLDVFRSGTDHGPEAAGGEYFCFGAKLGQQKFEDAIDKAEIAVVQTRLQTSNCVCADDAGRLANFHAWQPSGAGEESVCRNANTGTDDSAEIFALGGDAIEGCRGAEIHDHARPTVF